MATETPGNEPRLFSLLSGVQSLLGAGIHLLLLGLFLEGLTLIVRQWVSFPISLSFEAKTALTVPCVAGCVLGGICFNRSLDLISVHLLHGENELITHGPFAYVRHPLYATLLIFVPPLMIVWISDLLFLVPWALMLVFSHYVVRLEERGLAEEFGPEYERYRRYVPALLPYKGNGGRRYREDRDDSEPKRSD
jgi:protein-S-isoprenylcysteine O-methyltransferase Ste14